MKKQFVSVARKLRRNQTPYETALWRLLRRKDFCGLKFRRQYQIGPYIVDFCCPAKKIILELDGGGHTEKEQAKKDKTRDNFLQSQGYTVLRVWNSEFTENPSGVLEKIFYTAR